MINTNEELEIIEKLKEENALQKQQIAELSTKLDWFMEQFRLARIHAEWRAAPGQARPGRSRGRGTGELMARGG